MTRSGNRKPGVLILGIGNILMGDEGVGVHAIEELKKAALPEGVECLDGGTGSFFLLDPMRRAGKVILIDATIDDSAPGTIRKIKPRFSKDYPKTLTAHDIGLKDLLDAFYLMGEPPDVTLFAVTIPPLQCLSMELSLAISNAVPRLVEMIMDEATVNTNKGAILSPGRISNEATNSLRE